MDLTESQRTKGNYDLKNPVDNDEKNRVIAISTDELDEDIEAEGDRGKWSNQFEFFLSCSGFAVGLGNVWRFPYLCYKNGGGAFLIPYVLMLVLAGLPLFFMELAIGQYSSMGPTLVFKEIAPLFQGLGFAMLVITTLVVIYYNMIIAWALFYTVASFTSKLPWSDCQHEWNSNNCLTVGERNHCRMQNMTFWNKTCVSIGDFCNSMENFTDYSSSTHCLNLTAQAVNETDIYVKSEKVAERISSSEDYYRNYMLEINSGIEDLGTVSWKLALCLIGAWTIICLCLIKGVKSSGKVVYFTALFPYVVLVILLIRGVTLDGALEGIKFYIIPKWHMLLNAQVWGDAAVQIFYSLGPCWGGLITLSSYNRFNNNCYRDAIVIAIANCSTSVFAGFVVFSILGFMAHTQEVPVGDVVQSSQALAFIAYPEALAQLPISPLWAVLFFVMLITLGLDTQFTMVETVTTAFFDEFPNLRTRKPYIVVGSCFGGFILGLSLCTEGGVYLFNLMDWYAGAWSFFLIGFVECIVISWIYGYDRFADNIEEMIGFRPNIYWQLVWKYITPTITIAILFFNWYEYQPATYGSYTYSLWHQVLGWLMAFSSVIMIPIFAIYKFIKARQNGVAFATLLKPTENWGPAHEREKKLKISAKLAENRVNENSYLNEAFVPTVYVPAFYVTSM